MERSEHFVSSDLFSFRSWSTLRLGMVRFAAFVFCLNTWQERTVTALTNYKSPLKNWVSASTKFKEHQLNSEFHKAAVGYAEDFLRVQDGKMPSISQQLSDIYRNTVELNRQKLRSIIKTVVLCGKQNIALRGHCDSLEVFLMPLLQHWKPSKQMQKVEMQIQLRKQLAITTLSLILTSLLP